MPAILPSCLGSLVILLTVLPILRYQVQAAEPPVDTFGVGLASVDITPRYPVRLNGFGFRRTESEGVNQRRIWARAMAIGKDDPVLVIAVDNLGVTAPIAEEIRRGLETKGVKKDRVCITSTHTHTAPMLTNACPTIFGVPIPPEHQKHIDRYTREFVAHLVEAGTRALADRQPARLSWGIGKAGFAINRRTRGGPVDHDLPVLVARDLKGKIRAIWVNYACHAVTLSHNKIGGDWPGYAQQAIMDEFPGAVALVSIGCGADSNPSSGVTGDKVEIASRQGLEVARAVKSLISGPLSPVTGKVTIATRTIQLPLADLPNKEEWEKRGNRKDAIGHHARVQLSRLARGEKLRTQIEYPITTWTFGQSLGMVFLPGEVVVDYALRLKKELDGRRLWINAYSNDAPCYIPSERVLKEGGYEGGGAMVYYDVPGPFRPGLEKKILDVVKEQLGASFARKSDAGKTEGTSALSPQQSRASLQTRPGLRVELVAAEPLVNSPVAISFGPDGRLWVAEMVDYPMGTRGDYKPGGQVAYLEDTDGDGVYDKRTLFVDKIPFPTGVTAWRNGVLICAAPDILFAESSSGKGKADRVRKLFSGFGTDNYQARVNSLAYGLDGWVHGSCGLFGGKILSHLTGKTLSLGDRDFRIKPDTGEIEPITGRTQQGRVRDDWGNWFGCDNSTLARHYVHQDHYLRRNPHVAFPYVAEYVPDYPGSNRLYPLRSVQLFKLSGPPNQTTGACGIGVYRDDLLGKEFTGNLFTCEPVNLIVHRLVLSPRGSTFSGRRAAGEQTSELLASTDPWFRPVQACTGPDGALWVVDMYRFVIEHPRWIPPEDLARLDTRPGAGMGRIYRIVPEKKPLRSSPRLDRLTPEELVAALDQPNGTQRDLVMQMLLWRNDMRVVPGVEKLLTSERPVTRLAALCVLDGLRKLTPAHVLAALRDVHPGVRRQAIRLSEPIVPSNADIGILLIRLVEDADAQVRLQLAYSLGEWKDPRATEALARLLQKQGKDPHLVSAVLSSVRVDNVGKLLSYILSNKERNDAVVTSLLSLTASMGDRQSLVETLQQITRNDGKGDQAWNYLALGTILDGMQRQNRTLAHLDDGRVTGQVHRILKGAHLQAGKSENSEPLRLAAIRLMGRSPDSYKNDLETLQTLLSPRATPVVHAAALATLARMNGPGVSQALLSGWKGHTPSLRRQILGLLLARPAWTGDLVSALEAGTLTPSQMDAARREQLLRHRDKTLRARAASLFKGYSGADRQKVLKEYQAALALRGDAVRGKEVFGKHCSVCHRLENAGHAVGPDLSALANKTPLYLLSEILDPNRNLDSRYLQYGVTTTRGLSYTGLLASETATSISLLLQDGKTQTLLRSEVEELSSTGKSLMPEGLEKDISQEAMADLLAYLTRQRQPSKTFAGNHPRTITARNGAFALVASAASIYGGEICYEIPYGNIGHWHGVNDHVIWTVQVDNAAKLDVWLDWSCATGSEGNSYIVQIGSQALRGKVEITGSWDRYRQMKIGQVTLPAGTIQVVMRPDGNLRAALLDLRAVHLVPVGLIPALISEEKPKIVDALSLAKQILNDGLPTAKRQQLIADHPGLSADLLRAMTVDLGKDSKEEYRRIPWIWRVAIAAGKRNDKNEIRKILEVSLPTRGEPLRDWQSVVLGGGIINGISLIGQWPHERMKALLDDSPALLARWNQSLKQAAKMADDTRVPTGTRYDALRMIALTPFEACSPQLAKYLARGTHNELTMGAISGLADVDAPGVAPLLLAGLDHYSPSNRKLAIEALLRTPSRCQALLGSLQAGKSQRTWLSPEHRKMLRVHKDEKVRALALKILGKED